MTSTVVVSDCIELLNVNPDRFHVDYAVFWTAMMRELMPLICYGAEDVQISALAARLKQRAQDDKMRGFQACLLERLTIRESRHFTFLVKLFGQINRST
jgi:hypothetical protein